LEEDTGVKPVTLRAHFDGQYIRLDEPFELEPDTALIVTVLPAAPVTDEDGARALLARQGLAAAYSADEVENPTSAIKEPNPEYERG
jgi:hypothetical protein